jgi:hypothetical protein
VKSESLMWAKLRPILLAAKLDPVRVENPIHPGTPDVNFCTGTWMELKCIPAWPKRDGTLVRISHFTQEQRVWLYRRWRHAPGSTLLLLEVRADRQWLLFDGDVATRIVGKSTAAEHRRNARAVLHVRELTELPRIIAASMITAEKTRGSAFELVCTGSLMHDEFTPCPVHDVGVERP